MGISRSLISSYTTKLQWLEYYGTGKRTDQWSMGQHREPRNKPTHTLSNNVWQKSREYSMGEKTASSINVVGETEQLYIRDGNWITA